MEKIRAFLKNLGINPKNEKLFLIAFTHQTFSNEKKLKVNYQQLEFLGDSIIGKIITEYIYRNFKDKDEGEMSMLKSNVVKGHALAEFAIQEGFGPLIRFGKTTEDLKNNKNILEDVFEAFVAAIYLDQGEATVVKFLERNIIKKIHEISDLNLKNSKTILQEYLQAQSRGSVKYISIPIDGGYEASVIFDDVIFGVGTGKNKKEAEVGAAKNALKKVGLNSEIN